MKKELDEKLCSAFPELFEYRNADMKTTCMCWGFDCNDGWYQLISDLCITISNHIKHLNENLEYNWSEDRVHCHVVQVKEKFGGLRFYVDFNDEYISGAISMAEAISYSLCEDCGSQGAVFKIHNWVYTRCEKHKLELIERSNNLLGGIDGQERS